MSQALIALSALATLAGAGVSFAGYQAQADAHEDIAEFNARQSEIEAAREQAAGAARAELRRREAQRLAGRARAAMAETGTSTTSGSSLLLDADIIKEGEYQAMLELSNAQARQRQLTERAKAERFEGGVRASAARTRSFSSLLSGFGGFFDTASRLA